MKTKLIISPLTVELSFTASAAIYGLKKRLLLLLLVLLLSIIILSHPFPV